MSGRQASSSSTSSSSSTAGRAGDGNITAALEQLLLSVFETVSVLCCALHKEVADPVLEQRIQSNHFHALSLTDPSSAALQLLLSADFQTLLLLCIAAVTKLLHKLRQGRAKVTAAATLAAAYAKRSAWQQQQQQQEEEDPLAVPEWHQQLASGLGLPRLNLPSASRPDPDNINLMMSSAIETVLQARCTLAGTAQHTFEDLVVDIPAAAAAAAVEAMTADAAAGASNSSRSSSYAGGDKALHLRCPLMQQQLVLPLLLTAVELQALQCNAELSFDTLPWMTTVFAIWADVEQQQQQQQQNAGSAAVVQKALADSGLLQHLLHLLGPAALLAARQADDRRLAVEVLRGYGSLVYIAAEAAEACIFLQQISCVCHHSMTAAVAAELCL
jgi:hypothetical protein